MPNEVIKKRTIPTIAYDILTHTESFELYVEGLVQDCSKSIANALDTVALH